MSIWTNHDKRKQRKAMRDHLRLDGNTKHRITIEKQMNHEMTPDQALRAAYSPMTIHLSEGGSMRTNPFSAE